METCTNCNRQIGNLEKTFLFDNHVVCADCNVRLEESAGAAADVRGSAGGGRGGWEDGFVGVGDYWNGGVDYSDYWVADYNHWAGVGKEGVEFVEIRGCAGGRDIVDHWSCADGDQWGDWGVFGGDGTDF